MRIKIIILSLTVSITNYGQSVRETINQHVINNTYQSIEGVWEGTAQISLYVEKELLKEMPSENIRISFYNEWGTIKGSVSDRPQDKIIELTQGATTGSFISKSAQKGFQYVRGAGKQLDEFSLSIIEEHQQTDQNGLIFNGIIIYSLQKRYPLRSDFVAIRSAEIEKKKMEIENAPRSGTGFAISSNGLIVTCYHVVEKAKSIQVKGLNGIFSQSFEAEVVQVDQSNDLAIIKVDDIDFKSLGVIPYKIKPVASDVGEEIFVLGYPLTATMGDEVKLTTGIISSKTGFQGSVSQYQVSAPIQAGNSGGPLFDKTGNIIGIINSKHLATENVGYAIKATYLQNILDILPQKISTPNNSNVVNKSLPEKVKVLRNFIFLVEVNK